MRKSLCILIFVSLLSDATFAQSVANYAVTRTTGLTYTSISATGNAVNLWRNNTGAFQQDDNRSDFINIGFDFWYDGTLYTKLSVSTNGFIDFSSSTDDGDPTADDFGPTNSAFSAISAALATRPACAVFYDDLIAQGTSLGNSIRYSLTGIAPNRIFTLEWINMASPTNLTPSLNFQVKLYETTGVIDFLYGTMNTGTFAFSYTLGINAPNVTGPTAAELKNQITANTTTFSNTPQNGLVTIPSTNSRIRFTPPVPLNPVGVITFSAVTQTSMTLNWTNWATNEVGYVIYNSTDGVNFTFVTQTLVNATSTNFLSLLPGTTYSWRLYAVTEGCLSPALSGSQATLAATNKVSNDASGKWNKPNDWLPIGVPTLADNVTILNGHMMTINSDAFCNNLTVGSGASGLLRIGNNATSRTINVTGNITVNNGAQFYTNTASNVIHTLNVGGNIVNNGTINLASDALSLCTANFSKNGNQSISGTGIQNNFSAMVLNMGTSATNTLNVTTTNFSALANFLTLQNGTFRLANTTATNINISTLATATIGSTSGFTLSNANAVISYLGNLDLKGNLRLDAGRLNIGDALNEGITSNGGVLTINGGTFNIAGSYVSSTINNLSHFTMAGGIMTLATVGATASTTLAPFNITSPGSVVNISGGTIIIAREGGTGAQDLGLIISGTISSSVTGGILQIGNATTPASQIMRISTVLPVGNLHVNSANATAQQATALTILNNVNIFSGTFDANNLNTSVGGNWLDNANFISGTGTTTVTFNGTSTRTITDPTGEHFNNLTCAGDTVRLLTNLDIDRDLIINAAAKLDAGSGNMTIDIQGHFTNNGYFNARQGLVNFNGIILQQITSAATTKFFNQTLNNGAGASVVSGTFEVEGAYTPTAGNFNITAAISYTLLSTAIRTARIAQATTGTVTGPMNIQRFISARAAGYSDISSPVTTTTFADWDNELLLLYDYVPTTLYPSAWSYDEVIWDFVPVTAATATISQGKGFEVYLDSYGTYTTFDNTTLDSRGTPTIGDVNVSSAITFANDGWNLIGNPYASFISWDNLFAASTGVNSSILIYDEVILDYALFTTGSAFEIAPHQGFWIQANSVTPSVIFTESKKTISSNSLFRSMNIENFSLKLESKERANFFTSKTQIVSNTETTFERDIEFRSVPHPLAPKLYSINSTDNKYRLSRHDFEKETLEIPLGFSVGEVGQYSITASSFASIIENEFTCIILNDSKTGVKTELKEDVAYMFNANVSDNERRFTLELYKKDKCYYQKIEASSIIKFVDGQNEVNVDLQEVLNLSGTIQVYNMLGESVGKVISINNQSNYTVQLPDVAACYLIYVNIGNKSYVHKYIVR